MELKCQLKTEYRRYTGEEEDVIEGRTKEGESIKGPVKTGANLPPREVILLGDWKNGPRGRVFNFHSFVELGQIEQVRKIQAMIESRGFNRKVPAQVVEVYGDKAAFAVERNPYSLLPFKSASFDRCDRMWLDFGRDPKALKRQVLLIADLMNVSQHGNVWFKAMAIESFLRGKMGSDARFHQAIRVAKKVGLINTKLVGEVFGENEVWLASRALAEAEEFVGRWIASRMKRPRGWPRDVAGLLKDDQYTAAIKATKFGVGCLLGGGGTGKTYTISRMIMKISDFQNRVKLVAPTGKAAVRMSQAVAEAFQGSEFERCKMTATTIHRLIALKRFRSHQDEHFNRPKIEDKFFIVDESSMLDILILAEFLAVIPSDACVLFVGDVAQLPPVGPGAPLRDLMELPSCGEITKTRRNGGLILEAGKQIREGKRFDVTGSFLDDANLVHVQCHDDVIIRECSLLVEQIRKSEYESDSQQTMKNVQVIGVVNRSGNCSVARLNQALRSLFNPNAAGGYPFATGDKVINTQNGYQIPDRMYDQSPDALIDKSGGIYVANGEQGYVVSCEGPRMAVRLECPDRQVLVWQKKITKGSQDGVTGISWLHAYAITCHKSQGSQWPYVICALDGSGAANQLWDSSLIYTMISRAAKCCYLVGDINVAYRAIRTTKINFRKTFLGDYYGNRSEVQRVG